MSKDKILKLYGQANEYRKKHIFNLPSIANFFQKS